MVNFRRDEVHFWPKEVDIIIEGEEKPFDKIEISVVSCKRKLSWILRKIQKDKKDFGLVVLHWSCSLAAVNISKYHLTQTAERKKLFDFSLETPKLKMDSL